jgi:hypothetical protein
LAFLFFRCSWGSFLECALKLTKMFALHFTLGIAFSMRLDKRVSMLRWRGDFCGNSKFDFLFFAFGFYAE